MPPKAKINRSSDAAAKLGFEARLWLAADKLRNHTLGLSFRDEMRMAAFLPRSGS